MSTEGGSHFPPKHIIWQLHRWHRRGRRWATEVNIKCVEDLQPQYSEHAPEAPTEKPLWFLIGERSALGGDAVHTARASLVLPEMILGCRGAINNLWAERYLQRDNHGTYTCPADGCYYVTVCRCISLYATPCRGIYLLSLHVAVSNCLSVCSCMSPPATASDCVSLHLTVCHCMSLNGTACHGVSLHTTACHCMSLHDTACHYRPLHATTCHCMSQHVTACHCLTLYFTTRHCMPLNATARQLMQLHATT